MVEQALKSFHEVYSEWIRHYYKQDHKLAHACRYALEGPGKRMRPLIVLLTHSIFSEHSDNAMPAAVSIEMVHTYSLVHDDLPILDNDDLRRGRPTVHKVYDEALALLVGDALLSDAFACLGGSLFATLSQLRNTLGPQREFASIRELALAIGSHGMVLGQARDLEWTHRTGYTHADLVDIHSRKTGKLFAAAFALGAICGEASADDINTLRSVGEKFGLAYQIQDDLLDDLEGTGKTAGKDREAAKLTYLSVMSRDDAATKVKELLQDVQSTLDAYGAKAQVLSQWLALTALRLS